MPTQWRNCRLAMPQDGAKKRNLCSSILREERRSFPGFLMIPERGRFLVLPGKQNPMTLKQLAGYRGQGTFVGESLVQGREREGREESLEGTGGFLTLGLHS